MVVVVGVVVDVVGVVVVVEVIDIVVELVVGKGSHGFLIYMT
jgi:hypothetical protein